MTNPELLGEVLSRSFSGESRFTAADLEIMRIALVAYLDEQAAIDRWVALCPELDERCYPVGRGWVRGPA